MVEGESEWHKQSLQNNKAAELGITVDTPDPEIAYPWLLTDRPFERSRKEYPEEIITEAERLFGNWNNIKYDLGFQEDDLQEWKDKRYKVLEIGSGKGYAFAQLYARGINIYALEPSLKFPKHEFSPKELHFLQQQQAAGRIHTANAIDAAYAFPGKHFDVAFAIGMNFQNFASTEYALLAQLSGIMAALSPTAHGFLVFDITWPKKGTTAFNMQEGPYENKDFAVVKYLQDKNIKYEIKPFAVMEGGLIEGTAIKIYRKSENTDTLAAFEEGMQQDLSQYVAQGDAASDEEESDSV